MNSAFNTLPGFLNFACLVPLFEGLDKEELEILFQTIDKRVFYKGESIVREDSRAENNFYLIYSGRVKVLTTNEDGEECIYTVLDARSFFGEMSLLDEQPRSASVVALAECQLYILSKIAFFRMLELFPLVSIALLRSMSTRLREVNQQITNSAFMTTPERIRNYLHNLASLRGVRNGSGSLVVNNMPKQSDIAQLLNCTRESVSREISRLVKNGIITKESQKRLVIHDEKILQI